MNSQAMPGAQQAMPGDPGAQPSYLRKLLTYALQREDMAARGRTYRLEGTPLWFGGAAPPADAEHGVEHEEVQEQALAHT